MNKTQTIEGLRREVQASDNLSRIIEVRLHSECAICGEDAVAELDLDALKEASGDFCQAAATELYKQGWRHGTSRKFQVIGFMCGACHKTPDNQREG